MFSVILGLSLARVSDTKPGALKNNLPHLQSCSSVHSLAYTKQKGFCMSTATPLAGSLQRTLSTRSLQTIEENLEEKGILIIQDKAESDEASPKVAEANDCSELRP